MTVTSNSDLAPVDQPRGAGAVSAVYECFDRGDVDSILALVSEDVTWDGDWADNFAQRVPMDHFLPRRGREGVADFFRTLSAFTFHDFRVLDIMQSKDHVVVQVVLDITFPGGGRLRDEELHLWTLDPDGRITALRHYIDTAKHLAAARGEDTTRR